MSNKINFSVAVKITSSSPVKFKNLGRVVENYLYFGGKRVTPIASTNNPIPNTIQVQWEESTQKMSRFRKIIILTWFTGLIPLAMLVGKIIFRLKNDFILNSPTHNSSESSAEPLDPLQLPLDPPQQPLDPLQLPLDPPQQPLETPALSLAEKAEKAFQKITKITEKNEAEYHKKSKDSDSFYIYSHTSEMGGDVRVLGRHINVHCPRKTAVKVDDTTYLHANWVGEGLSAKKFIAAQGPIPSAHEHFWKVVLRESTSIIDLIPTEQRKPYDCYYPTEPGIAFMAGMIAITLKEIANNESAGNIICTYEVKDITTQETKEVKRLHFLKWQDRETIDVEDLHELVQLLNGMQSPSIIHCSAGVGRTGTLIAAAIIQEKIQNSTLSKDDFTEISALVLQLREQRGEQVVQQEAQFATLYEYAQALFDGRWPLV